MIMATSRHKSVQSLQSYQQPSEKQLQKTAALLDYESVHDDDIAEIDECLASATPQQLLELEQPGGKACFSMTPKQQPTASPKQQPSAASVPMNFGGAHFEGCTIHLTVNLTTIDLWLSFHFISIHECHAALSHLFYAVVVYCVDYVSD